jgi:hypothetical protein
MKPHRNRDSKVRNRILSRRCFVKYTAKASEALLALGLFPLRSTAQGQGAAAGPTDFIFCGGSILTMNARQPRAEALAIQGQRILAVGTLKDVEARINAHTRVIDLAGRTLMSGMFDQHIPFGSAILIQVWPNILAE